MKHKIFFLIILSMVYLPNKALGEEEQSSIDKICANLDKLASISSQFTYIPWQSIQFTPSGPVPGVVIAVFQPDNTLLSICQMRMTFKQLEGADKGFAMLGAMNKLNGDKNDAQLSFLNDTYSVGVAVNNLNKLEGGLLDKAQSFAPTLNAYLGSVNDFKSHVTGEESETFMSRDKKESRMNSLASAASRIALLQDVSSCPVKGKDQSTEFSADTSALIEELGNLKVDLDFLLSTMRRMGVKFSGGREDYIKYENDLFNYFDKYASYSFVVKTYERETVVRVNKTGKVAPDEPKTKEKKKMITNEYQLFTTNVDEKIYDEFVKKYVPFWQDVLSANALGEVKGVATRKAGGHIEEEFRDSSFECRDSEIYRIVKSEKPDFFVTIDDSRKDDALRVKREECQEGQRKERKEMDNLFEYYAEISKGVIRRLKNIQAEIWTIDSYYNGTVRIITQGDVKNSSGKVTSKEEVTCSEKLNLTELATVKNKSKQELNNLRTLLLEEQIKKTAYLKHEQDRDNLQRQETERRRSIEEESIRRQNQDYCSHVNCGSVDTTNRKGL